MVACDELSRREGRDESVHARIRLRSQFPESMGVLGAKLTSQLVWFLLTSQIPRSLCLLTFGKKPNLGQVDDLLLVLGEGAASLPLVRGTGLWMVKLILRRHKAIGSKPVVMLGHLRRVLVSSARFYKTQRCASASMSTENSKQFCCWC